MSSIFLRIYGGLLFAIVLVAVLSGLALTIVNGVRLQDYRESVARGTFRIMDIQLANAELSQWQPKLSQWENQLGINLSVIPTDEDFLDRPARALLAEGRVLVRAGDGESFEVFSRINEQSLLRGAIDDPSEQLVTGTAAILRDWLLQIPKARRPLALEDQAVPLFGYPVRLLPSVPDKLSLRQQQQLDQGGVLVLFNQLGRSITLYTRLTDSGDVLQLGPAASMDPYPFKLLVTLGLFMLASISIAIYILVRGLERRLSKMERVALRLSKGDLDARVKVFGGDSVGQLAAAFNSMASHLQRLLRIQREMIRGVSHELRTPVARIRFGLEMVADAETHAERESYISGIDGDIEELDHLIDEILTYARLEEGLPDISLKHIDAEEMLSRVVREHQRQKTAVQIEQIPCKVIESRRTVDAEERYIHRAIQNLVSNACRYADSKVQVHFSVGHDTCRIDVEDDGPGIPRDQREKIFTAFARLDDSRTRASGGYGLGLSIVQRIMHWHNGKVLVGDSERLGGARFSLVWPRRQRGR